MTTPISSTYADQVAPESSLEIKNHEIHHESRGQESEESKLGHGCETAGSASTLADIAGEPSSNDAVLSGDLQSSIFQLNSGASRTFPNLPILVPENPTPGLDETVRDMVHTEQDADRFVSLPTTGKRKREDHKAIVDSGEAVAEAGPDDPSAENLPPVAKRAKALSEDSLFG